MHWFRKKGVQRAFFLLLALGAVVSTAAGVKAGVHRSQDFQWSGAHLMAQHIDPWAVELNGDPDHLILGVQHVNYLPLLYLLFLPLGYLQSGTAQIVWVIANVFFAVTSTLLAARFFRLSRPLTFAAVCLMLMAMPIRNNLGNGQQALFVLFMLSLSLLAQTVTPSRSLIAGVSYVKFNFSPPVFLYLLFNEGPWVALVSIVPAIAGLLAAWAWLGFEHDLSGLLFLVTAPLKVSQKTYWPRGGDTNLMDVLEPVLNWLHVPVQRWDIITLSIALLLTVVILYRARRGSAQWRVALLGLITFCLYKHHGYDATTLLFPFCFALSRWRERSAMAVMALIGFIWYGQKILLMRFDGSRLYVVGFFALAASLVMLYRLYEEQPAA